MVKVKQPQKVWVDAGSEFKGSFKTLCEKKQFQIYKTFSEKKSAFAERNIRSLKNLIYKYLEDKWTYSYINELQNFVKTVHSRINRETGLAPSKVSKKHVSSLVSLSRETNSTAKVSDRGFCTYIKRRYPFQKRLLSKHSQTRSLKLMTYQLLIPQHTI